MFSKTTENERSWHMQSKLLQTFFPFTMTLTDELHKKKRNMYKVSKLGELWISVDIHLKACMY